MADAFVFGVGVFDSVALEKVDDIPEPFLSLHSVFHKGRRTEPALPVSTFVVSVTCFLPYLVYLKTVFPAVILRQNCSDGINLGLVFLFNNSSTQFLLETSLSVFGFVLTVKLSKNINLI